MRRRTTFCGTVWRWRRCACRRSGGGWRSSDGRALRVARSVSGTVAVEEGLVDLRRLEHVRDRITSQVFGHWWGSQVAGTSEAVPHLRAALGAVAQVRGRLVGRLLPPVHAMLLPGHRSLLG